ncbi:hypothetical protein Tco_1208806 [Tanacetum coccineum]
MKGVMMSKHAVTIHGFSESLLRGQTRGILVTSADESDTQKLKLYQLIIAFQETMRGNNGMSVNQVDSCSRSSVIDYGRVLPQYDGSLNGVGQRSVRDAIMAGGQCSNNVGEKQISFGKSVQVFDQGPLRILGLWVKGHQFQVALLFTKLKLHQAT